MSATKIGTKIEIFYIGLMNIRREKQGKLHSSLRCMPTTAPLIPFGGVLYAYIGTFYCLRGGVVCL